MQPNRFAVTDLILMLPNTLTPMMPRDIVMQAACDQSHRRERPHDAACHGPATIPDSGATLMAAARDTAAVRLCYCAAFKPGRNVMDQKIINLYDNFTHSRISRREF